MVLHVSTFTRPVTFAVLLQALASTSIYAATPTEEMSQTVEKLCPALKKVFTANPAALTPAQQDVLFRCGELKLAPGQSFSDLSGDQLTGLNTMTSDETSSMSTSTVELSGAQGVALTGRLATVRSRSTVSVASLTPSYPVNGRGPERVEKSFVANDQTRSGNFSESTFMALDGGFSQVIDYGKWGVFLTAAYGTGDKDATSREPGFDFDSWSLVSGVDYRINDALVMGVALSYGVTDSTIDNGRGDVEQDAFGVSLYGTYYLKEFYLDFIAGYATSDYDTVRNMRYNVAAKSGGTTTVNHVFDGNTDADDFTVSLGTGYTLTYGGFSVTPFGQVKYLDSSIDGYTESLRGSSTAPGFGLVLQVDDQDIKSLTTNLGVHLVRAINTSKAVLTPYVRVDWEHEYENDSRNINARFAVVDSAYDSLNRIVIPTDDPDRDFINFGTGLSAVFPGGIQAFIDYSTILALDDISLHMVSAGVRFEF